jgi:putative transposase
MSPAYKRYFTPNAIVFLTLATAGRKPVFENPFLGESALGILNHVKALHPFQMKGYVMMPDHWHLMIHTQGGRFDKVVHSFKRNVTIEFHKKGFCEGAIWQDRFYDHVIRDDDDFSNHLDYIHFNPVHHGNASSPAEYPFSSFHHYVELEWYSLDWGNMIPEHIKNMNLE